MTQNQPLKAFNVVVLEEDSSYDPLTQNSSAVSNKLVWQIVQYTIYAIGL